MPGCEDARNAGLEISHSLNRPLAFGGPFDAAMKILNDYEADG